MKKLVLLSLLLSFVAVSAFSQSFQLFNDDGNVEDNTTINYWGEPTEFLISHINIKNISDVSKTVLLKKVIIDTIADSRNTFCWGGLCFASDTYVSPVSITLAPEEEYDEFEGHYEGLGTVGISTIRYVFFDENNVDDSVSIIVNYSTKDIRGLSIAAADGHISDGMTFDVSGEDFPLNTGNFRVLNFADSELSVKVKKVINEGDTLAGTLNTFWWGGTEYDAATYESDEIAIEGLGFNGSFYGSYYPEDVAGTSTVNYEFFDVNDPLNVVTITVNYTADPNSINEENENILFSNAYPNPASGHVKFDYQFKDSFEQAKVLVHNLLGAIVKESIITGMNGTHTIYTGEINKGVYFYSLVIDGSVVISKKLVIK